MKQIARVCSVFILFTLIITACKDEAPSPAPVVEQKKVKIPAFNQDSAYHYVDKQVSFGPRVPGSDEHQACKEWMVSKFKSYGASVIEQDFDANIYTGDVFASTNIIAQFNPSIKKRVILSAHWDSRMIAEEDKDVNRIDDPILGADDGASGVGVLIEIARIISENPIDLGVDIILFDAEDQGKRGPNEPANNWCLGAQHWSRNQHVKGYKAKFGILLDMVGSKNPRFGKDQVSKEYAGLVQEKVWNLARNMGYTDMFVDEFTGMLTDDHYFVNVIAGIPMIDIINQPKGSKTGFMQHWHTHGDDMSIIDKRSLRVVGQVVSAVIYKESGNQF